MLPKLEERDKAVELRSKGYSFSEILREVPVAKSSLSLWLRKVHIKKSQKYRLNLKQITFRKLGAKAKRKQRIEKTKEIVRSAILDINPITDRELFLMGVVLYWAEGAKQRNAVSQVVEFSNSDPFRFGKTCFTRTVYPRKNKRKDNGKYFGQLRIRVKRSTDLNRKIAGWTKGICLESGVAGQNKL
jgi:hypothetical protein